MKKDPKPPKATKQPRPKKNSPPLLKEESSEIQQERRNFAEAAAWARNNPKDFGVFD